MINTNFEVEWSEGYYREQVSPVYFVDTKRDLFLVADDKGYFSWIDIGRCRIHREEEDC